MEVSTFDDVKFDRADFAKRFESFINVEREFVDGGLVVALTSKFGTGKTSFLQMWEHQTENGEDPDRPTVVSLNAWESDYFGDPLFAVGSALVGALKTRGKATTAMSTPSRMSLGSAWESAVR